MKIKPIYFYIALGVLVAAILLVSALQSQNTTAESNLTEKQMPADDVHKGLNNPMGQVPGGSNVTSETKQKMDQLKSEYEKNPGDTAKALEYADFLQMAHRPVEALPIYESILNKDSRRVDVLFAMTFIYYNQPDLKKAEELTERILKIEPGNVMALYNQGAIEATKGNKEKARSIWTDIIKNYPESETTELAKNSINRLDGK